MSTIKPYRAVPIIECGEPMVSLPAYDFALKNPHTYETLGAPYGNASPWFLRKSIAESLGNAQRKLQQLKSGWKILLTDAYRPNAVQAFMVEHEFSIQAQASGLNAQNLSEKDKAALAEKVYRIWAIPSDDPLTPPPHSTGAAFDCTLADENGNEIDMGSPIDENSDRSAPDFFAGAKEPAGMLAHANRCLLRDILATQGFVRHHSEWWHFSRGDQIAVWIEREKASQLHAIYGRAFI